MFLLACLGACAGAASAEDAAAVRLSKTIPLPGVEGRIDHMAVDVAGKRLVVAALGNNSVEVIDLEQGKVVHRIDRQAEPQGVLILPESGRILVSNGDDGTVRFYDGTTFEIDHTVELPSDADNARFDAAAGRAYVGYGTGALCVIEKGKHVADIRLKAHPEAFTLETKGKRIFVNVPNAGHVAVVDREKGEVVATWPVKEAKANFPVEIDEAQHRLFVGCRSPAKMLVFDTETGKTVATLDISGDVDDIWYEAASKRLYLSCGEGFLDLVQQKDADHYERTARVPTAKGARTSLFLPGSGTLLLAVPHNGGQPAEIRVYKTRD